MKRLLLSITLLAGIVMMNGCKKEPTMVYVSNTQGLAKQTLLLGTQQVQWDVYVTLNGHDYGLVKAGETAGPFEIKGTKIEIERFEADPNCLNDVLWYKDGSIRYCLSDTEWTTKEKAWQDAKPQIALNKTELTLEIGYGAAVDND